MLKATRVTKKFGELVAVDDLNFHIKSGQIYGIAGPNGAGKSTVFNLITGHYDYEGRIERPAGQDQKKDLKAPIRITDC